MFVVDEVDPLGRRVVMDAPQMSGHIVPRHQEMLGQEEAIAHTIRYPSDIYDVGGNRNIYLGNNDWWVEVIVDHTTSIYGVVVTAWG